MFDQVHKGNDWHTPVVLQHLIGFASPILRSFPIEIRGQENLPDGSAIYVCNHLNSHDIFIGMLMNEIRMRRFNRCPLWRQGKRERIVKRWLGSVAGNPYNIISPMTTVYGKNVHIGKNFFANTGLYIQDYAEVTIGNDVFIGPHVCMVTVEHPLDPDARSVRQVSNSIVSGSRGNFESAKPVHIGNNVLIYSGAVICPGVTIGDNTVIGAGSVVTKSIPANVFACGVPCQVVKSISKEDIVLEKENPNSRF